MSHYFIEFNYNKMTIKLNPQIHMANMQKKTKHKNKTILLFKNHAMDDEKVNEMYHLINKGEIIQRGLCTSAISNSFPGKVQFLVR